VLELGWLTARFAIRIPGLGAMIRPPQATFYRGVSTQKKIQFEVPET